MCLISSLLRYKYRSLIASLRSAGSGSILVPNTGKRTIFLRYMFPSASIYISNWWFMSYSVENISSDLRGSLGIS